MVVRISKLIDEVNTALIFLAGLLALAGTAEADDKHAVGHLNGKMELIGGKLDDDAAGAVAGSISFPISSSFGGQIDTLGGRVGNDRTLGIGGHLFRRKREQSCYTGYQIGVSGKAARIADTDIFRYGLAGEVYLLLLTVSGGIGLQHGDVATSLYGSMNMALYADENFMLNFGITGGKDIAAFTAGVEWSPRALPSGVSLFAQGDLAGNSGSTVSAGLRWYIGRKNSLIRHHRQEGLRNRQFRTIAATLSEVRARN